MEENGSNIGKLLSIDITKEAKKAYLDYAMSVIVSRALPDVRDGMKPVHRRILFAMYEMGLTPQSRFSKSAKIVGEAMGKYHPHGDMPIYDALVRLAQDFSMRYPLVHGQGNFGSMDGDPPAAMRYTEAKLSAIAMEMLFDIDKDTVEFIPNFDATLKEPVFLPAKLPNLLLMGSEGIAVGMATKIPPHNLTEVIDAIHYVIKQASFVPKQPATPTPELSTGAPEPTEALNGNGSADATVASELTPYNPVQNELGATTEEGVVAMKALNHFSSSATIDDLLEYIKGPDFPTGGAIFDINEIKNVYKTGRGRIIMRGVAEIEDIGNGKSAIIIRELPYQVNKAALVAKIAELAKDKKLEGISDLRDESDRHGIQVMVELKRDVSPKKVLNNLYKQTSLQTVFPANVVALVDQIPRTLNLKTILEEYLKHRFRVVVRRSEFELKEAKARLHILEGLRIAVDNIDAVIQLIRSSANVDEARKNLMERFKLSEIQATAILDMQLRRLAALEREKLEEEWKMVKELIDYLTDLLGHPDKILTVIKDELSKIKEKYQDVRRTRVYKSKVDEFSEEDLIQNEPTVISVTKTGYIKRQGMSAFKTQHRGGKGIRGMTTKEEDILEHLQYAETHDYILFFTNKGKVYQTRVYEIPEGSRVAKGQAIVNLLEMEQGETISSILSYNPQGKQSKKFIFMATTKGTVKKTSVDEFANIRRKGIVAIKMDSGGDSLSWVRLTTGKDDIFLVTKEGKIIGFSEEQVRPTGRSSMGVRGIKLGPSDEVVSMDVVSEVKDEDKPKGVPTSPHLPVKDQTIFVIAENGLGKRTRVTEVRNQNRGGQGVRIANITPRTGKIVFATVMDGTSIDVIITSEKGQLMRIPANSIPTLSRNTQGVILMRFSAGADKVASATPISGDVAEEM